MITVPTDVNNMPAHFNFGSFTVTPQVFYYSRLSFALVNLKPLLPGHVLVSPIRPVPRFSGLSVAETTDLFLTVRRVSRMLERVYRAGSFNIAIQDGADAGQSVPHVHVHVIPRRKGDFDDRGGGDAIYEMMEGDDGDLGELYRERGRNGSKQAEGEVTGKRNGSFGGVDAEERSPRTKEEMRQEADMLRREMELDPVEAGEPGP